MDRIPFVVMKCGMSLDEMCIRDRSLTAAGVASQVAVHVSSEDIQAFIQRCDEAKNYGSRYQPAPVILLEFLTEHIPYEALRSIYTIILKNYRIGRKIPKLIHRGKASVKQEIHRRCVEAANVLDGGNQSAFAKQAAEIFRLSLIHI